CCIENRFKRQIMDRILTLDIRICIKIIKIKYLERVIVRFKQNPINLLSMDKVFPIRIFKLDLMPSSRYFCQEATAYPTIRSNKKSVLDIPVARRDFSLYNRKT